LFSTSGKIRVIHVIIIIIIYINTVINYKYANHIQTSRIIMKIREVIQEFVPCEICGNSDIKNFYFHVLVDKGSQPYVKCCECEEEYYSARAKEVLTSVKESRKGRTEKTFENIEGLVNQDSTHPLVKVLAKL